MLISRSPLRPAGVGGTGGGQGPPPSPLPPTGSRPKAGGLGLWGRTRSAVGSCRMRALRGLRESLGSEGCIGHQAGPDLGRERTRAGVEPRGTGRGSPPDPPPLLPRVTEPLPLSLALPGGRLFLSSVGSPPSLTLAVRTVGLARQAMSLAASSGLCRLRGENRARTAREPEALRCSLPCAFGSSGPSSRLKLLPPSLHSSDNRDQRG